MTRSNSGLLLATANDFSTIKVYRYPSIIPNLGNATTLTGHSSHVTSVRWSVGDECLLSTGGEDKCIFQWRHVVVGGVSRVKEAYNDEDKVLDVTHGSIAKGSIQTQENGFLAPTGGDESGAIKPWLGAIRPPKNLPKADSSAPNINLSLEWVHGYTAFKVGNSALYTSDPNSFVYPAASLAVKFTKALNSPTSGDTSHSQSYFTGHKDDVISIGISGDGMYLATGQICTKANKGKAGIMIWSIDQVRQLAKVENCHERGVSCVSFSPTGNMLLTVGLDNNNTHTLFEDTGGHWSSVKAISSASSDKSQVNFR